MELKNIKIADVLMLAGALGYFILPADIIPDIVPGVGFADDAAALTFAFKKSIDIFSNDSIDKARKKSKDIFGDSFDEETAARMILNSRDRKKR